MLLQMGVLSWSAGVLGAACWRMSKKLEEEEEEYTSLMGDGDTPGLIELNDSAAWLLPLGASVGLMLMYYFSTVMFWLTVLIYAACVFYSLPFVLSPIVGEEYKGTVSLVAVNLIALWLVTGHWLLHDILTAAAVIAFMCHLRPKTLRTSILLVTLLTLYDVFWVFYSDRFFGEGVMVSVATNHQSYLNAPGTFVFPAGRGHFAILGAGDVVFPGLVVLSLLSFEKEINAPYELTTLAAVGYVVGMMICQHVLNATRHGQPALLYLTPAVVLPPFLYSCLRARYDTADVFCGGGDEDFF